MMGAQLHLICCVAWIIHTLVVSRTSFHVELEARTVCMVRTYCCLVRTWCVRYIGGVDMYPLRLIDVDHLQSLLDFCDL